MKKLFLFLAVAAVVAGFILVPRLTTGEKPGDATSPGLDIGQVAPDFKLKNVDGRLLSLTDVKDANDNAPKGYIVTFTCNTCPYAVMYEDRIIELHNKFAPRGWPVVAIQPNDTAKKPGDSFEEMQIRAKDKNFSFVYLIDEKQEVYPKYGATKTPHVFLLDAAHMVKYIGAIDNNPQDAADATRHYVAEAIEAIETGKVPDPAITKAIGCGIKSK
ncbi:MAG: thioredoxin family protein [Saprospiraceae bacterium]|nr:thioredoxin family protein [Saprospiraceae bacterium]MCF8250043.1 thioredoxin family protein [Saprospiraceae bacterium]MCF8283300.1 thioredoxin family protein [Bacteroidales bacterium]MCF8311991.1 thioredoxin family protein [Saprospiraceae bacterium]MCF8440319.1 thioredoxin family protein [Saprospiraceae bacterium]